MKEKTETTADKFETLNRRSFLSVSAGIGWAGMISATAAFCSLSEKKDPAPANDLDWKKIRELFSLSGDFIHMSAMLISSHPRPVREAIEMYHHKLDCEHVPYLQAVNREKQEQSRKAAANYLGVMSEDIALTESTTMGLATIYQGLQLKRGDEVILAKDDYYSTYESLRLKSLHSGARMIEVELYHDTRNTHADTLLKKITEAISPATRVIALTWVHSGTGLKLPVKNISAAIHKINSNRELREQIIFCLDGVHGLGIEDFTIEELGCDIFIAGCHKWLFGPRGTGIVWGSKKSWEKITPLIPSFIDEDAWERWRTKSGVPVTTASLMSPGGFKSFEHLWALPEAFNFHLSIGKTRIAARTHELANSIKHELGQMQHICVHTPKDDSLSCGIISFDVKDMSPWSAVEILYRKGIIASVNPYSSRHIRLSPCIYNSDEEVETTLGVIRNLQV